MRKTRRAGRRGHKRKKAQASPRAPAELQLRPHSGAYPGRTAGEFELRSKSGAYPMALAPANAPPKLLKASAAPEPLISPSAARDRPSKGKLEARKGTGKLKRRSGARKLAKATARLEKRQSRSNGALLPVPGETAPASAPSSSRIRISPSAGTAPRQASGKRLQARKATKQARRPKGEVVEFPSDEHRPNVKPLKTTFASDVSSIVDFPSDATVAEGTASKPAEDVTIHRPDRKRWRYLALLLLIATAGGGWAYATPLGAVLSVVVLPFFFLLFAESPAPSSMDSLVCGDELSIHRGRNRESISWSEVNKLVVIWAEDHFRLDVSLRSGARRSRGDKDKLYIPIQPAQVDLLELLLTDLDLPQILDTRQIKPQAAIKPRRKATGRRRRPRLPRRVA